MQVSIVGGRFVLAALLLSSACSRAGNLGEDRPRPSATSSAVVASDVDAFWSAYDSAQATTDSLVQLRVIQTRYIDRGTRGVRGFMSAKGYTAEDWVGAIRRYPKFWASIRSNTYRVNDAAPDFAPALAKLRELYPALRPATIYIAVGALRSSGTTQDSIVLIGAELVAGTPATDISEFAPAAHAFLARYFATYPLTTVVSLNVHEYVHTQQRGIGQTVLALAVREGSADFLTELVTGKRMPQQYMDYGPAHEPALRETFKAQMFTPRIGNWFYNQSSADAGHVPDLGYYMGYAIARAYYERAPNKRAAIREMIELPFDDDVAVEAFLNRSGYYAAVDKAAILRASEAHRPVVTRVVPVRRDGTVDPRITELRIEFSAPMAAPYNAIGLGPGGRAEWPLTGRIGFSHDGRAYTVRVALQPRRTYRFVMEGSEGSGFRSADGWYPLRPDTVAFTTLPPPE